MARGILYVMETVVPGLIKIGKTGTNNFESRMYTLEHNGYYNVTGLKRRFAIEVDDYDEKEQLLDTIFSKSKVTGSELFAVDINLVVQLLSSFDGKVIYPKKESKEHVFDAAAEAAIKEPDPAPLHSDENIFSGSTEGNTGSLKKVKTSSTQVETALFYYSNKKRDAKGEAEIEIHLGNKGKRKSILKAGSKVSPSVSTFDGSQRIVKRRKQLEDKGVLVNRVLTSDVEFDSQSAAVEFLGGSSLSGNVCWKTADGVQLKQLL